MTISANVPRNSAEAFYPPAPAGVPRDLTAPSRAYRVSAWLATLGLLSFVAVYLGLTAWFGLLVWRVFLVHPSVAGFFLALPPAFFFGFLVRGLWVVRRAENPRLHELTRAEQPRLFDFLDRLADEVGAPRPHRVFVSAGVNAGVFYDLSFVNLLVPSRKNLEIGLGLVEALTLDEMKAVLAHEFGHFAQRTMAVGRWVYTAQQVAGHIIMARTAFDRLLMSVSYTDLRIAWIGWVMRLFVWAIRAVLDSFFRLVVLADRALSRQMEFNADLVSVSVSGSDSLIHSLRKLGHADAAWREALDFAANEESAGRPVADLFVIQREVKRYFQRVLEQPDFGEAPVRTVADATAHRVFDERMANPPQMWSTHPPNRERENNAKRTYLPSVADGRPAWSLFDNSETLRTRVTRAVFKPRQPPPEGATDAQPPELASTELSLQKLDERFSQASLLPRYRGAYLGRSIAAWHASPATMYMRRAPRSREEVLAEIDACYPASIRETLTRHRDLVEEEHQLEGLEAGVLTAAGGVIRHRGREVRRHELRRILGEVREDRRAVEAALVASDVACRSVHFEAAQIVGHGWPEYLAGLLELLHYATHAARAIRDAHGYLAHVFAIVTADQRVSDDERRRLVAASSDLYGTLWNAFSAHPQVTLPSEVERRFSALGGFSVFKEKFALPPPDETNLGEWLAVIDDWALNAAGDLSLLASVTLDALLDAEAHVAERLRDGERPGSPADTARVPSRYATCVVGAERERQKKLDLWDRFQTADGFLPGLARFAVASALLVPALALGGRVAHTSIHAHNGLAAPVSVTVGDERREIDPHSTVVFSLQTQDGLPIEARTLDGRLIERFRVDATRSFGGYVYNVARATAFVRWTAFYGSLSSQRPTFAPAGTGRFFVADEDAVLTDPPQSISSKSGNTRTVITALDEAHTSPSNLLASVTDAVERSAMIEAHLRFDPSGELDRWIYASDLSPPLRAVLAERARSLPDDVMLQRAVFDQSDRSQKASLCAGYRARAEERPNDPDRTHLAIRCLDDAEARARAFLDAFHAHPEHGLSAFAAASVLARKERWSESLSAWEVAMRALRPSALRSHAAVEALRTRRAAAHAGAVDARTAWRPDDASPHSQLAFLDQIEGRARPDEPVSVTALRELSFGDVERALAFARGHGSLEEAVVQMAATRPDAEASLVARALAIDVKQTPYTLLPARLALALRARQDVTPIERELAERFDTVDVPALTALLRSPSSATTVDALDTMARGQPLAVRGALLAAGVAALRAEAPPRWLEEARALLFSTERGF